LKASAMQIDTSIGRATLASWREAIQPPAVAWWWSLDQHAAAAEAQPHPLWAILAGFCITMSLSFTTEISHRFLSGGPDFLGVFSTLSQGLLTLFASSVLIEAGRERVDRGLSRLGIQRKFQHAWRMGFALLVLLLVIGLRSSLPAIARYYNNQGTRLQQVGFVTSAIDRYQRAISLYSDYAEAHYNLATAYEDVLDYDKALGEYQTALRADSRFYFAYNNLARLYMLRRADFASALTLLNAALELKPEHSLVQYSLFKNRGWANFGLKYLASAKDDLKQALQLRDDGAAAHCLFAQVLEAEQNQQAAMEEWDACKAYAPRDKDVEASWLGLATERLR